MGNLISCIWTPSEGPAPSTAELKWDLPEGVLCRIFDLLRVKQLERCCSVTKRWRTLILENHDLKLERAWRMGKIEPKRSNFNFKGHKICKSAKQGDMIAVGTTHMLGKRIAIMDLGNGGVFYRTGISTNGVLRFIDGILFSGDDEIGIVRVWDVPELVQRSLLKIPEKVVDVVDASEHVAVCGSHGYVGLWKKEDWSSSRFLQIGEERITCFTYFKGRFYCGLRGGEISVWCEENADRVAIFHVHDRPIKEIGVNKRAIVSCSIDGDLKVVGRERGECLPTIFCKDSSFRKRLRMSHKQFAWKKYKYTIQVWDADEDRCIRTIQLGNGYMINDGYLRGVYLTADKLTVVNTKGEVLQFDFGSMDE